jgi:hypothetical protein
MLRWRERVRCAADGCEEYDFIHAFFQSCYHLRDWLVATQSVTWDDLNTLFDSSIELQLYRDICNATKHLKYDRPSIEPEPMIARDYDPRSPSATELRLYSVTASGQQTHRSISALMDRCVAAWDAFLLRKGSRNHRDCPVALLRAGWERSSFVSSRCHGSADHGRRNGGPFPREALQIAKTFTSSCSASKT